MLNHHRFPYILDGLRASLFSLFSELNLLMSVVLHQALQEQLTSSVQEVGYLIKPISTAAKGEAAQLGHKVRFAPIQTVTINLIFIASIKVLNNYSFKTCFCLSGLSVGQLLYSSDLCLNGHGLQNFGSSAADEPSGSDQDARRVCSTNAVCCQGRWWKSKGTSYKNEFSLIIKRIQMGG